LTGKKMRNLIPEISLRMNFVMIIFKKTQKYSEIVEIELQ